MNTTENIQALADESLLQTLTALSAKENEATVELLFHLAEVDRRRLYLPQGYSSMFSFLTQHLRYSEPAANRRLTSARALREFPELANELLARNLSLTTLSLISSILNQENLSAVLTAVRAKSRREVEEFLSTCRPRPSLPKEQIKPLVVAAPKKEAPSFGSLFDAKEDMLTPREDLSVKPTAAGEGGIPSQAAPGAEPQAFWGGCTGETAGARTDVEGSAIKSARIDPQAAAASIAALAKPAPAATHEQRYELRFSISGAARKKLEEAKLILSGKYPCGVKIEDVFEEALETLLEKRSPKRRLAQRVKRQLKEGERRAAKPSRARSAAPGKPGRHIPCELKDAVHARDDGRCTFVSPAGVRCLERADVELHHVAPYGRAGAHEISNLRLLCRAHNAYQAGKDYGVQYRGLRHDNSLPVQLT